MTQRLTDLDHAPDDEARATSRRTVLLGAGLIGAGGVLAACGSSGDGVAAASSAPAVGGAESTAPGADGGGGGEVLGKAADVPVGSGTIFASAAVVVTQPTKGEFRGFSTRCPHQGCAVSMVQGATITCPCHGSTFSIVDGSRTGGPAPTGLTEEPVTVSGGEVMLS